jgi:hypothetical protein
MAVFVQAFLALVSVVMIFLAAEKAVDKAGGLAHLLRNF